MGKVLSIAEQKAKINKAADAARHENYCNMPGSQIARLHPLKQAEAIECLKAEIDKLRAAGKPAKKPAKKAKK